MSEKSPHIARIAAVRRAMAEKEIPGLLVTDLVNVGWLTGFTGSNGFALITQTDAVFATDSRYTEQAAQQCPDFRVEKLASSAPEEIIQLLVKMGVPEIGFESEQLTVSLFNNYRSKLPA